MLFNSIDFAIFLPIVFFLYWFAFNRNLNLQNLFLLVSSYVFYSFFDWRFIPLLFGVSFTAYIVGIGLDSSGLNKYRRLIFTAGILICAGVLALFKFYGFLSEGYIIPLGISFYTFLSLSYMIDVYQRKMKACHDPADALLAMSFFPILLAGPIQRPSSLLPQIQKARIFDYDLAAGGLRQILTGLFMKILIADNCAVYANDIFANHNRYNGSTLLIGAVLYSIQIYADFAGYSEIAIGTSKLLGIRLMRNFAYPYFAKDIIDFWRRWHISLTLWFRDYIFLPLSFSISRMIKRDKILGISSDIIIYAAGIFFTWSLTGLWHGANMTFIIWGLFHGTLLLLYHVLKKPRKRFLNKYGIKKDSLILIASERLFTLAFIIISWIIFRSESTHQAFLYLSKMFSPSLFTVPEFAGMRRINPVLIFSTLLFTAEYIYRLYDFTLENLGMKLHRSLRWSFYVVLILCIYLFGNNDSSVEFIYFQF